jgi:hypothetical protein
VERRRCGEPARVGVIERAAVLQRPKWPAAQHKRFELSRGAEFGGDKLGVVQEDGRVVVVEGLFGGDDTARGAGVGVDLPDHHVVRRETRPQAAQCRGGLKGARRIRRGEHQHDNLCRRLIIEFARRAVVIGEAEVRDHRAGREAARVGRGGVERPEIDRWHRVVRRHHRGCAERGSDEGEQELELADHGRIQARAAGRLKGLA